MTGKFSNVTKRDGKNQEAQQTPTRVHTKKFITRHIHKRRF